MAYSIFDPIKCPYCGGQMYYSCKDHGRLYYYCPDCRRGAARNPRGRRGARIPAIKELAIQHASQ